MKKSTQLSVVAFLFLCILFFPALKIVAQVSGVKTIPGDYATINEAILQIKVAGVSGPTFLELQPEYNSSGETFPITIREIPGVSPVNSLTISPAAGASGLSIISATNGPVINLIGAYSIIIDGRPGRTGTARELTIRNNATGGNAISFVDGAIDNLVRYCKVEGSCATIGNSRGIVYFGPSFEPLPVNILFENASNEISNCIIRGINSPKTAIFANGAGLVHNDDNKIINNEILNFVEYGIEMYNTNSHWTITGNSIYNLDPFIGSTQVGIHFGNSVGSVNNTISGNFIGGRAAQAGGFKWLSDHAFLGIVINAGSFVVENNVIQNFRIGDNGISSALFEGIRIIQNATVQITGNLIGGSAGSNDISVEAATVTIRGITNLSCSPVSITNNRISNIRFFGYQTATFTGILHNGGDNLAVTGNQIDQIGANGPGPVNYTAISLTPNPSCPVSPNPSTEIDRNLINNITLTSDDGNSSFTGIELNGPSVSSEATLLHNNEVYKINVSSPNSEASFTGLSINDRIAGNTGNIIGSATEANSIMITGKTANATAILVNESADASISDDIIGNINVNGTLSASLNGIRFQGGGVAKVTGNQLSDLSVSGSGPADMLGIGFNGAVTSSEPSTLHNNKIYKINVSSSDAEASFAGININDRISGNTGNIIGSATEANSIMITGKTADATAILVYESADASISDDIIGNITVNGTLSASLNGIHFQGGGIGKVNGNQLNDLSVSSSGPAAIIGIGFNGAVTSSEPSTLHNNQVYKINVSSSDAEASFAGISINDRISSNTGNIIGSATEANSIMVTGKTAFANGILLNNSPDVSISDDIIANITAMGTLTPASVNGILFEGGAIAKISGNNVHHLTAPVSKGIFLQPSNGLSTVTLEKNILTGINTGTGIETFVASEASLHLTATDNTISNWQTGVLLDAANGATLEQSFQNNSVVNNQTGFINETGTAVNATCNWWGHASGPSGAGPGTGNPVGPNVIFSPWATIATYIAVNAGDDQTIYIGYGPTSKTLKPTVTVCGTPTFLWSTGATTPAITVSPTVATVYSVKVTDANGHEAADEVTVFVVDARCGNNNNKVRICHNGKEICVSANAVQAHLNHGNNPGSCVYASGKVGNEYVSANGANTDLISKNSFSLPQEYRLSSYPNPFAKSSTIRYELPYDSKVSIKVYDVMGRVVAALVDAERKAGIHSVDFKAGGISRGVLYYKIVAQSKDERFEQTNKMIQIQ